MAVNGYEFLFEEVATGVQNRFGVYGISEDVAKGIRKGLRQVPTITNVAAERIVETRETVAPDPAL